MICWREKWLSDSRPFGTPDPDRIKQDDGELYAISLATRRADLGLDQPYGSKAVELKIGPERPVPSRFGVAGEDPTEPQDLEPMPGDLREEVEDEDDEQLPGDAAEVPVDDLPFQAASRRIVTVAQWAGFRTAAIARPSSTRSPKRSSG